jgi:hypothetical protein
MMCVCEIGTIIKPGLAQRVDPGPGGWTSSSLLKDQLVQQPSKTRSTRRVNPLPGRIGTRPFFLKCGFSLIPFFSYFFSWLLALFKVHYINIRKIFYFFNVGFETFSIYTLYSQEKSCIYTLCSQEKSYDFQCEIWNPSVNILYVHNKKIMFFQCGIKKFLV